MDFASKPLPEDHDVIAPDGSEVRILLSARGGSMAHFRLQAGHVSAAVRHRSVDEIWYVLDGYGEMWRRTGSMENVVALGPHLSLTIPVGTSFQFRAGHDAPLSVLGITMPPWPGPEEAEAVEGHWRPTSP